jgi:gluconolactonase
MDLGNSLFPSFYENAFSYLSFLGLSQQPASLYTNTNILPSDNEFLNNIPPTFENVSVSFVKDNLAVIPGEWEASGISKFVFYLRSTSN